jgi:rhodanese-related sulfurtransferase
MTTDSRVDAREARRWIEEGRAVALDVVAPHAWEALDVALPGAVRIPPDQVDERHGELPRDKAVVAYCT